MQDQSSRSGIHIACWMALAASLAVSTPTQAALKTWQGPDGGAWETAANWNPNGEPGQNDDVVINPDSKTIKLTTPKVINSLDVKPSVVEANKTKIESTVNAMTGEARELFITARGVIPQTTIAIRIGAVSVLKGADSVANPTIAWLGGEVSLWADAENGEIEIAGEVYGGKGADISQVAQIGLGLGGPVVILARGTVRIDDGKLVGGNGGNAVVDPPPAPNDYYKAGWGGSVRISSGKDLLLLGQSQLIGGRGGNRQALGTYGGDGGAVTIAGRTKLENHGMITGGEAGTGEIEPLPFVYLAGSGGGIRLGSNDGAVDNRGTVIGGAGVIEGGAVIIGQVESAKTVSNRGVIRGGNCTGFVNNGSGGHVFIYGQALVENLAGALIQGGTGCTGTMIFDQGPGGAVVIEAKPTVPGGDFTNDGIIRGGSRGPLNQGVIPAGALEGGDVVITAKVNATLKLNSRIEGGRGSDPVTQKPRGDVFVGWALNLKGVPGSKLGPAKRIHAKKELANNAGAKPLGGPAGTAAPLADFDFSGSLPGSIVADELVCIDTGPGGVIDFTGIPSTTDAIIVGEGRTSDLIHITAGTILTDRGVTLDEITLPPSTVETSLCTCCRLGCPADMDLDGDVDGIDLGMFLGQWGPCRLTSDQPCPADLDGNGFVNGSDLAILLAAWGPC